MITKLKDLMSLNAEISAEEIESRFTQIAKLLFENFRYKREKKYIFSKRLSFISIISIIGTSSHILVFPILCVGM